MSGDRTRRIVSAVGHVERRVTSMVGEPYKSYGGKMGTKPFNMAKYSKNFSIVKEELK